jgi:glycerol-3-phosphate dehydrogenase (NAD(P)+)
MTTVLGAGAWGTALASVLAERGEPVTLWAKRRELSEAIAAAGENARYLPGIALPSSLSCTHDLAAALEGATMVVLVVPSHAMREVVREAAPHIGHGVPIVSATKGISPRPRAISSRFFRAPASRKSSRRTCPPPWSSPRGTRPWERA